MVLIKQHKFFFAGLALMILMAIAGCALAFTLKPKFVKAHKDLKAKEADYRRIVKAAPAPTTENLQMAEKNFQDIEENLAKAIAIVRGKDTDQTNQTVPNNGTDVLFRLETYSQEMQNEAAQTISVDANNKPTGLSVIIPRNFAFGFSRYLSSKNPPSDNPKLLKKLYLEMETLEYILKKLLAAKPRTIQHVGRQALIRGGKSFRDEFSFRSQSARIPDVLDTLAFKIIFEGSTKTLRDFLQAIQAFDLPLSVRSITIEKSSPINRIEQPNQDLQRTRPRAPFPGRRQTLPPSAPKQGIQKNQREIFVEPKFRIFTVIIEHVRVQDKVKGLKKDSK